MKPGRPLPSSDPDSWSQDLQERFLALVDQREPGECWSWLGPAGSNGDGRFAVGGGRHVSPRRVAYILHNGPIPPEVVIYPICRFGSCCNPAHLRARNRRGPSPLPTVRPNSADLQTIRALYGILPVPQLARLYRLHTKDVRAIWAGRDPFPSASKRQDT